TDEAFDRVDGVQSDLTAKLTTVSNDLSKGFQSMSKFVKKSVQKVEGLEQGHDSLEQQLPAIQKRQEAMQKLMRALLKKENKERKPRTIHEKIQGSLQQQLRAMEQKQVAMRKQIRALLKENKENKPRKEQTQSKVATVPVPRISKPAKAQSHRTIAQTKKSGTYAASMR
ncbi:MAG: hypothetical protein SGILL_009332, partial [Bacillariaceae sp.]